MRRFNPEKELRKIQHGNKNKIIFGVMVLLIIIGISSSYALYQVRYSKRIIYTKVAPFSNKDISILAIYLDDKPTDTFPEKGSKVVFDRVDCDNDSTGAFNTSTWELILKSKGKDKCSVYFKTTTNYIDDSGANPPELYQGLIPVTIDNAGKIHVANLTDNWYDYDEKRWANAVLVDYSKEEIRTKYFNEDKSLKTDIFGDEIPISEVFQMYVWIPRYKYQLFNVDNGSINPQEIQIEFESGILSTGTVECEISDKGVESCNNAIKGEWYTHPAFRFGNTGLTGIWVGKFESSGNNTNVKVVPNVTPIVNQNISYMFNASRNIEETYAANFNLNKEEIDAHMMKNMEWGAMAYLTHSKYGRCDGQGTCTKVAMNTRTDYKTGYNGTTYAWNTVDGQLASTTGNQYGIYDTNGGAWDYVMGNMVDDSGSFYSSAAGFSVTPDSKYFDVYEYDASSLTTHARGHLGDATRETLQIFGNTKGGWYGVTANFLSSTFSWFHRGGRAEDATAAGTFAFHLSTGDAYPSISFRVVLTAQDGNS